MSEFSEWRKVKTRKDRHCNGCGALIAKGTVTMHGKGKHEGSFFSVYLCDPCNEHMEKYHDDFRDGWCDGDIGESRREVAS